MSVVLKLAGASLAGYIFGAATNYLGLSAQMVVIWLTISALITISVWERRKS